MVQFGLLALIVIRQTLQQPARHVAFLAAVMVVVTLCGWGLGTVIRSAVPWTGLTRFVFECALWLAAVALIASPLASKHIRARLSDAIPQ